MAKCRDCGADIRFIETTHGRLMPANPDGSPHPATCPESPRRKRTAGPDNECAQCHSDNVERLPGTRVHFGALRCHDCGAHRWLRKPRESQT